MLTIHKYKLVTTDFQDVAIPAGGRILCVQVQRHVPCLWALVDTMKPYEQRHIRIYGTGNPVDAVGAYIGTYQLDNGFLVFHVFEVSDEPTIAGGTHGS